MSNPKYHDDQAAGIYRAIALRFHMRYVQARNSAEFRGGDLSDHGRLSTLLEADERYNAVVENMIVEAPDSANATLALVEFAGILAADRLIGEVTREPVDDEQDAYHQVARPRLSGRLAQRQSHRRRDRAGAEQAASGAEPRR
jgi:hypothetical protein